MKIEYEVGTWFKSLADAQRHVDQAYNRAEDLLPYYQCRLIKKLPATKH